MESGIFFFIIFLIFLLIGIVVYFNYKNNYYKNNYSPQPVITEDTSNCKPLKTTTIFSKKYTLQWCVDFSESNYDFRTKSPTFMYCENGETKELEKNDYKTTYDDSEICKYEANMEYKVGFYNIHISTFLDNKYKSKSSEPLILVHYSYPRGGFKPINFKYDKDPSLYTQTDTMTISWDAPSCKNKFLKLNYIWEISKDKNVVIASCDVGQNTNAIIKFTNNSLTSFSCGTFDTLYLDEGEYNLTIKTYPTGYPSRKTSQVEPGFSIVGCLSNLDCNNGYYCSYINNTCIKDHSNIKPTIVIEGQTESGKSKRGAIIPYDNACYFEGLSSTYTLKWGILNRGENPIKDPNSLIFRFTMKDLKIGKIGEIDDIWKSYLEDNNGYHYYEEEGKVVNILKYYKQIYLPEEGRYKINLDTISIDRNSEDSLESTPFILNVHKVPEGGYKVSNICYKRDIPTSEDDGCLNDDPPIFFNKNRTMLITWDPPKLGDDPPKFSYDLKFSNIDDLHYSQPNFCSYFDYEDNEIYVNFGSEECGNIKDKTVSLPYFLGECTFSVSVKTENCGVASFGNFSYGPKFYLKECGDDDDCNFSQKCNYNGICSVLPPSPVITSDINSCTPILKEYVCFDSNNNAPYTLTWCVDYTGSSYDPENVPPRFFIYMLDTSTGKRIPINSKDSLSISETSIEDDYKYKYEYDLTTIISQKSTIYNIKIATIQKPSPNEYLEYGSKWSNKLSLSAYAYPDDGYYEATNFRYNNNEKYGPVYTQNDDNLVISWNNPVNNTNGITPTFSYEYNIIGPDNLDFNCRTSGAGNTHSTIELNETTTVCHGPSSSQNLIPGLSQSQGDFKVQLNTKTDQCGWESGFKEQDQGFTVVECKTNNDCENNSNGNYCDKNTYTCGGCISNDNCKEGYVCDSTSHSCILQETYQISNIRFQNGVPPEGYYDTFYRGDIVVVTWDPPQSENGGLFSYNYIIKDPNGNTKIQCNIPAGENNEQFSVHLINWANDDYNSCQSSTNDDTVIYAPDIGTYTVTIGVNDPYPGADTKDISRTFELRYENPPVPQIVSNDSICDNFCTHISKDTVPYDTTYILNWCCTYGENSPYYPGENASDNPPTNIFLNIYDDYNNVIDSYDISNSYKLVKQCTDSGDITHTFIYSNELTSLKESTKITIKYMTINNRLGGEVPSSNSNLLNLTVTS